MLYECAKFVHVYIYLRSIFIQFMHCSDYNCNIWGYYSTCKHISSIEMNPIKL